MKNIRESIFSREDLITGREWYHQRHDGAPMFIFSIADAEMLQDERKPKGTSPGMRVCFFSGAEADWYLDMADVRRAAEILMRMAKKDSKLSAKLRKAWEADERRFDDFFWREFPEIELGGLTDRQLRQLWKRYYKLAITRLSSTAIIDHFSLGTDSLIDEMIRREVRGQTKNKIWTDTELAHVFATATAPVHQSFISLAEIDLLKIITRQSAETLRDYQRRYFWIKNNYATANTLSLRQLEREIKAREESKKDPAAELEKLRQTPEENRRRKEELFRQYKFSPLLKSLLKVSEDFTAWQDERKRATYLNIHLGSKLLEEIGRRTGYTLEQLKYTTGFEVEVLFSEGRPAPEELEARREKSVFLATPKGYYVATGDAVEQLKKVMGGENKEREVNEFRGLTASLGKARGRVRIIRSASEVGKIVEGEILVAIMTRPDYIPAMKKAAAIVTNEGGITSHAAIVSRELGIPCVIGTKVATEVLRDGDLVEVNADHSKVTILEKNR